MWFIYYYCDTYIAFFTLKVSFIDSLSSYYYFPPYGVVLLFAKEQPEIEGSAIPTADFITGLPG